METRGKNQINWLRKPPPKHDTYLSWISLFISNRPLLLHCSFGFVLIFVFFFSPNFVVLNQIDVLTCFVFKFNLIIIYYSILSSISLIHVRATLLRHPVRLAQSEQSVFYRETSILPIENTSYQIKCQFGHFSRNSKLLPLAIGFTVAPTPDIQLTCVGACLLLWRKVRSEMIKRCIVFLFFFVFFCAFRLFFLGDWSRAPSRAVSVPPFSAPSLRALSLPPRDTRATSVPRFDPLSPLDLLSEYEREPFERCLSPTPVKSGRWAPRSSEVAYDSDGNLVFATSKCVFVCILETHLNKTRKPNYYRIFKRITSQSYAA